jgi:hypothetical protein
VDRAETSPDAGDPIERGQHDPTARVALPVVSFLLSVGAGLAAFPFTVDDAFILGRYATRIATGLGYTFNDGPPTDGVTGPLGLAPGVLAALVGLDAVLASKIAGLVCAALACALVVRRAGLFSRGAATAAGLFVVLQPTFAIWSVAGLETGAATLAVTVAGLGASEERPRGVAVGVAIGSLGWLRPELALAAVVLLVMAVRHRPREGAIAIAIAAVISLALIAFRSIVFGGAIPLSAYAKPAELGHGVFYAIAGVVLVTGLGGVALAVLGARAEERLRWIAIAIAVAIVSVAIAGGDWMPGFRLLAPFIPLYALLAARGVELAREKGRVRRIAIAIAAAMALLLPAIDLAVELPLAREAGHLRDERASGLARELAGYRRVALVDIGFLTYETEIEPIDLAGVTDPAIARMPGGYLDKHIDEGFLSGRDPDAIVLHALERPTIEDGRLTHYATNQPVERRIARMDFTRTEFRVKSVFEYHPSYFYVVLERVETGEAGRRLGSE